jgi:Ni/Co efflux regulator RcnB
MNRKLVMALAVAAVFAAPMSAYAQSDEKEPKKPEQSQLTVSQSDEKETTKPEQGQPTLSQSDEKEPKKPELVS